MLNEVFSDYFAQRENFLSRIDTRVKMVFVIGLILMVVSSRVPLAPIIAAVLSMSFLLSIRIPLKLILLRLTIPLGVAAVILLTQIFFYGTTPIIELNLFGFHLQGYKEGLLHGFLIVAKVIGSVSWIIFLSMTTPVNKLLNAARWFKVPHICIEIFMFTFRYIFVLLEDAITVRNAQKVRLGYSSFTRSLQSIGQLAGAVVIRSYDQSMATYEAMLLRGYNGRMMNFTCNDKFSIKDGIASAIFIFIMAVLFILNKAR